MRLVKLLIYSLVFFSGLIFLFSLLFPSNIRISKTINMKADQQELLAHVSDLRLWKIWNPSFQFVSTNDIIIIDSTNGKVSEVKINNTSIKITDIKPDGILMEYSMPGKKNVHSGFHTIQYPGADSMVVNWYMDFTLKWYPWEKFSSLLFEKMYGEQMKQGLENLKQMHEGKKQ